MREIKLRKKALQVARCLSRAAHAESCHWLERCNNNNVGVTAGKANHNGSNARGVTAAKMGRNSSNSNLDKTVIYRDVRKTYLSRSALFLIVLSDMTCLHVSIDILACRAFNSFFSLMEHHHQ